MRSMAPHNRRESCIAGRWIKGKFGNAECNVIDGEQGKKKWSLLAIFLQYLELEFLGQSRFGFLEPCVIIGEYRTVSGPAVK